MYVYIYIWIGPVSIPNYTHNPASLMFIQVPTLHPALNSKAQGKKSDE